MENLTTMLANLLVCCDRTTTTYEQYAIDIIEGLEKAGYFIGKNEVPYKDVLDVLSECFDETMRAPEPERMRDAKYTLGELNTEGYRVVSKTINPLLVKWCDASNATVKGWAIVIYKRYDVQSNEFDYHPKLIRGYASDKDLIKGETRAHLLCEFELPA